MALNIIIAIGVPIGLTNKLNMLNTNATTHSNQRLFVLRKNILLL